MSTEANNRQNNVPEVIEVKGNKLIETVEDIFAKDNVSRVIIYRENGQKLLDIPYAVGLSITVLTTIFMPPIALLTPFVLLLMRFKIEVVRPEAQPSTKTEKKQAPPTQEAKEAATSEVSQAASGDGEAQSEVLIPSEVSQAASGDGEAQSEVLIPSEVSQAASDDGEAQSEVLIPSEVSQAASGDGEAQSEVLIPSEVSLATSDDGEAVAESEVASPSGAPEPDDFERIKGIGEVFAERLHEAGIDTFAQLAELPPEQVSDLVSTNKIQPLLDAEAWIAQARELSRENSSSGVKEK